MKVKLSSTLHPRPNGQIEWVNQNLEQYVCYTTNYHQDNWLDLLSIVEFSYNNIVHSLTQQTPFSANHGLHPKFDIQGVNKIVNPTIENWIMWLANIRTQLVSSLEKTQRWYKEDVNEQHKEQPSFKVGDQVWLWWQNIKTAQPLKKLDYQRLGPFTIMKQINVVAF